MKDNRFVQIATLIVLLILLILVILLRRPTSQPPATEAPTTESVVTEPPPTEPSVTEPPVPTDTPTPQRTPPSGPIAPGEKVPLDLESEPPFPVQTVIGFLFPDGQEAFKAAPKESIAPNPDGPKEMTLVGIVEVGSGAPDIEPGLYSVAIDLASEEKEVNGLLILAKDSSLTYPQHFSRIPLVINPARDSSTLPDPGVGIRSDSVCFVVGLGGKIVTPAATASPKQVGAPKSYFRYCSVSEPYLSASNQFAGSYATLRDQVAEAARALGLQRELNLDLSISELEDSGNIESCNGNPEQCQSDILGAPVSTFYSDYDKAKSESPSEPFAVTAGFVRVQREMNLDGIVVAVGNYQVEYWFTPDGTFIGATFYGKPDGSEEFIEPQIPASEQAFLNADGSQPITSDISAWKLVGRCVTTQRGCT